MRIFLADDNPLICAGLTKILRTSGRPYEILGQAAYGIEALQKLGELGGTDLLITDICMPMMDGVRLLEAAQGQGLAKRVLVLSGYDDFPYVRASFKGGAADYLLKPIDRQMFLERVAEIARGLTENDAETPQAAENSRIARVQEFVREHCRQPVSLQQAADWAGLSPAYFSTLFRAETGEKFSDYLTNVRMEQAKQLLRDPGIRIYEVAGMVGYPDPVSFSHAFKKKTGLSPQQYRAKETDPMSD